MTGEGNNSETEQQVKLDEIMKMLFSVSQKPLVTMMNSLFGENFDEENTEVTFESNEFVSDDYNIIRGDLFLRLQQRQEKLYHYHIEFQTVQDTTMVIRMFEYGFKKAKELSRHESADETVIYIPKQLVIFVEQNKNIRDELRLRLIFPCGEEVKYKVPVMKYWEYETPDILEQKLYPLLPLQVFKLRHRMEQIKRKKGRTRGQIEKAIMEAKELTVTVAREGRRLFDQKEINGNDLHEILMAAYYIFEYLNNRYLKIKQLNKEVHKMLKTLHDPAVEQRGIEKGIEKGREEGREEVAKQMLLEGEDVEKITKYTGLSKEKIKKLKT